MDNLGAAIRAARLRKGMSLRAVAGAADISASLLSQVETGKTQPSVGTLYALVGVLEVSLDELMGTTAPIRTAQAGVPEPILARPVQRAAENPTITMENGVTWERLAVDGTGMVEAIVTSYAPGASSSIEGKFMRHTGVEYGYVIEGELTLKLDFDTYVLGVGDSVCFDSQRPHMYENHTDRPARGVWFVVGGSADHDAPSSNLPISSAADVLQAMGRLRVETSEASAPAQD